MISIMSYFGNLLGQLSTEVTFVVDQVVFFIGTFLNFNYLLVRSIVNAVLWVSDVVIVNLIYSWICCFNDFKSFLCDVFGIGTFLIELLERSVCQVFTLIRFMWSLVFGVKSMMFSSLECVTGGISWVLCRIVTFLHLLVRALNLIWDSIIVVLGMGPRIIVYICCGLYQAFQIVAVGLSNGFDVVFRMTESAGQKILGSIWNIPWDAYFGIVLLVCSWYLAKRFKLIGHLMASLTRVPAFLRKLRSAVATRLPTLRTVRSPSVRVVNNHRGTVQVKSRKSVSTKPEDSQTNSETVLTLRKQVEQLQENTLCVVCQENPRCVTLLPCCHLCLCQPCTTRILEENPDCPICRRHVREALHVYT